MSDQWLYVVYSLDVRTLLKGESVCQVNGCMWFIVLM